MDLVLFFDGCHKIYYAQRSDTEAINQMLGYGYEVIDGNFIENLNRLWDTSCGLRFIEPANLDPALPTVEQCEPDMGDFADRLRAHYA